MFCGAIGVLTGVSVDTSSDTVDGFGECGRSHNVSPPHAEPGASPSVCVSGFGECGRSNVRPPRAERSVSPSACVSGLWRQCLAALSVHGFRLLA